QPAADAACLCGCRTPDRDGDRAVCHRVARGTGGGAVEGTDMRRALALLACVLIVAVAAGCGAKKDVLRPGSEQSFNVMLDYFPNADHAPIYAAQANGDFKAVGLDVKIRQPADPSAPIKQVA